VLIIPSSWGFPTDLVRHQTLASPVKKRLNVAVSALATKKSIIKTGHASRRKLIFAKKSNYFACKGYQCPSNSPLDHSTSHLAFGSIGSFQIQSPISTPAPKFNVLVMDANQSTGSDGLEEVVNDIAYRFWDCGRCLPMGHDIGQCQNKIRCRSCF
jgi:hypothetical protein